MSVRDNYDEMIAAIERAAQDRDLGSGEVAAQVAELTGYSVRDLNAVMSFLTGSTLVAYIRERKLMHAYEYLVTVPEPKLSVAVEIAGYDSQSALNKRFTERFGFPPGEAVRRKDRRLLTGPLYWDFLGGMDGPDPSRDQTGGETAAMKFGIPKDRYKKALEAAELQAKYGLPEFYSNDAWEFCECCCEEYSLEDSFRFLASACDYFGYPGTKDDEDGGEVPMTDDELWDEVHELIDDEFVQFMFFKCGLSISGTVEMREYCLLPPEAEMIRMDPAMIRAFISMRESYEIRFDIFKRAYELYTTFADENFGDDNYDEYLQYLNAGMPAEDAFEMLIPSQLDFDRAMQETMEEMAAMQESLEAAAPGWGMRSGSADFLPDDDDDEEDDWYGITDDDDVSDYTGMEDFEGSCADPESCRSVPLYGYVMPWDAD